MKYKQRKKYQRLINRIVRNLNKVLYNDEIWLGRFYAHQINAKYYTYTDDFFDAGSYEAAIELVDKKTNKKNVVYLVCSPNFINSDYLTSSLYNHMYYFIYGKNEASREEIIDFRR